MLGPEAQEGTRQREGMSAGLGRGVPNSQGRRECQKRKTIAWSSLPDVFLQVLLYVFQSWQSFEAHHDRFLIQDVYNLRGMHRCHGGKPSMPANSIELRKTKKPDPNLSGLVGTHSVHRPSRPWRLPVCATREGG